MLPGAAKVKRKIIEGAEEDTVGSLQKFLPRHPSDSFEPAAIIRTGGPRLKTYRRATVTEKKLNAFSPLAIENGFNTSLYFEDFASSKLRRSIC